MKLTFPLFFCTLFLSLAYISTCYLHTFNEKLKQAKYKVIKNNHILNNLSTANDRVIDIYAELVPEFNQDSSNRIKNYSKTFILCLSYMSIIASLMVVSTCLSVINLDLTNLMLSSTLSTMFGKTFLGPPVDFIGGNTALSLAMSGMSCMLFAASYAQNGLWFRIEWSVLSLLYSCTWGAVSKVIQSAFPPQNWTIQINTVAAASRLGSLMSSLIYGNLIKSGWGWRRLYFSVGVMQAVVVTFVTIANQVLYSKSDHYVKGIHHDNGRTNIDSKSSSSKSSSSNRESRSNSGVDSMLSTLLSGSSQQPSVSEPNESAHQYTNGTVSVTSSSGPLSASTSGPHSLHGESNPEGIPLLPPQPQPPSLLSSTLPSTPSRKPPVVEVTSEPSLPSSSITTPTTATSAAAAEESPKRSVPQMLKFVAVQRPFQLMLLAKSMLMMAGQFPLILPSFLESALGLSRQSSVSSSAVFAFGSLMSNVLGARYYASMQPQRQVRVVTAANMLSVICVLALWMRAVGLIALAHPLLLLVLGLWGASWSLPFYIPPGIMALRLGGQDHSALLSSVFDAIGLLLAAIFTEAALIGGRSGRWADSLLCMIVSSVVACVSMYLAMVS